MSDKMQKREFDAVVVGSGPNGLAAAITMQLAGLSVLLVESNDIIGGGLRSSDHLTLPGFTHDICSAVHPLAAESPFFKTLPLHKFGLEYIYPAIPAAHPFDNGNAALLHKSIEETAKTLGKDEKTYINLMVNTVKDWKNIDKSILGPLSFPKHPYHMVNFGLKAIQPALLFANRFKTQEAKGLFAGMAAHSIQPLGNLATSAIALVLMAVGHLRGWPIPKYGSQSIANALVSYFISIGGKVETNFHVSSLKQLPASHAVLFDITPRQLLKIAGHKFSSIYKWQLEKYRYGMGVFKIDWALSEPIPFKAKECREAGTLHLGSTLKEIAYTENISSKGKHPERPFVLLAQPSIFDSTRAPEGKHTGWAYCHVPNGSTKDMTEAIENQVERYAPGFKDVILARHTYDTSALEAYNTNYVGGDINGGIIDIRQLFTRPALRSSPYRTSAKGIYICSSSTPPGGGVHGMCGYHAARRAMKDIFSISVDPL